MALRLASRVLHEFIMTKSRLVFSAFIAFVSMWLGWTVLVDFFVIPTVFKTIDNIFHAGDLGISVFSKFNNLELIVASALVGLISFQMTMNRKALMLLIMTILVWLIAMTYFSFLTPKLIALTELWKKTDLMGITGVAGIPDIQQEHQFYHNLYIRIDGLKLILLTAMLFVGIYKKEQWE